MWLKACPRCHGDLYARQEPEGLEVICLQCSRMFNGNRAARPALQIDAMLEPEEERVVELVA